MWDLIASVPDHCLSFSFTKFKITIAQRDPRLILPKVRVSFLRPRAQVQS